MTHLFVPYEQALALKELGFDEPCFGLWNLNNGKYDVDIIGLCKYSKDFKYREVLAPTFSQVFKWLRNNQNLYADIFVDDNKTFGFMITYFTSEGRVDKPIKYNHITYEEAELACLRKLINICKKK